MWLTKAALTEAGSTGLGVAKFVLVELASVRWGLTKSSLANLGSFRLGLTKFASVNSGLAKADTSFSGDSAVFDGRVSWIICGGLASEEKS